MTVPLGAFDLHAPFAKGGMGEIWRGRHRTTGTWVAVKVLTERALREERMVAALDTEIRAAASLDHPNIVWLYDAGKADQDVETASEGRIRAGCPWMAMELAGGGTLRERAFQLDWIGIRRVLLDLLDALAHAHARAVIHRDIKPSNVLFMGQGTRIKLADFGMVYAIESAEAPLSGGTPSFMAPEQFEGDGRIQGPWTDLYSVGCLAWSLACGHRPYHGQGSELYKMHATRPVPRLTPRIPVPDGLQAWIERLMAKAPANRYQRAAEAARALIALPLPAEVGGPTAPAPGRMQPFDSETERTTLLVPPQPASARRLGPERPAELQIPSDWRGPERRASLHLMGAGLGLFGLRELPMIDRENERDVLWSALHTAHATQTARAVVIRGPSGFGKSRLAEWICRRAHEVGAAEVFQTTHHATPAARDGLPGLLARVLRAHGVDQHEFRDHLDQLVPGAPPWVVEGSESLCAGFFRSVPLRPVRELATAMERFAVVSRVLRSLANGRVALVWLDDVQWGADALRWVAHVLGRQDAGPALILLTAQEEALVERVDEDDLLEELDATTLSVGPLDDHDRRTLSRSLLALDPTLADELAQRTGGNPLFAVQLVGDWVARGLLSGGDAGFTLREGSPSLPEAVESVWDARIGALLDDNPDWAVPLEIAAVLGLDVWGEEWSEAARLAGSSAPPALVLRLLAERLAVIDPEAAGRRWRFVHGMLRETLVDRARKEGRLTELHRACADALTHRGPERADRLASHLLGAEDYVAGIDALFRAARHAMATDPNRARARLLTREDLLERLGIINTKRVAGWYELSRVERMRGDLEASRQWIERVLAHARKKPDVARAHVQLGVIERMSGRNELAIEHLESGAAMARELGDFELLGSVLIEQSHGFQQIGDTERAERAVRAVTVLQGASAESLADSRLHLAYLLGTSGQPEEGLAVLKDAVPAVEATGRPHLMANLYNTEGELSRMAGDLDRAERAYRDALGYAERLGTPFHSFTLNLGLVALERGRIDEAETWFREVADKPRIGQVFQVYAAAGLIATAAARGDWRGMRQLKPAVEQTGELCPPDLAWLLEHAGRSAHKASQADEAAWALGRALWMYEQLKQAPKIAEVRALLA